MGFGLGYSVRAVAHTSGSEGAVSWGGAFGTLFWVDPKEELVAIILTQGVFSSTKMWAGSDCMSYN